MQLGESEAVRIVPTLLALHALPADQRDRRAHYVGEIVDKLIPAAREAGAGDQRRRLLRDDRLHARRGRAAVQGRRAPRPARPAPRRAIVEPARRRARRAISRAVGRSSRASRRGRRQGDGRRRHRRGAPARRFLRAAGKEEAAGRAAAQAQGADRGRDRLQPRHLAFALADAGDEHGVHFVRPDAGGSAGRNDDQRRARARARP